MKQKSDIKKFAKELCDLYNLNSNYMKLYNFNSDIYYLVYEQKILNVDSLVDKVEDFIEKFEAQNKNSTFFFVYNDEQFTIVGDEINLELTSNKKSRAFKKKIET